MLINTQKVFFLVFLLITAVMVVYGLAELLAPEKLTQLQNRIIRAERWSTENPEWKPRSWMHRLAGIAALLMAGWMIWSTLTEGPRPGNTPSISARPPAEGQNGLLALGTGLTLIGGGVYLLVKPAAVAVWAARFRMDRIFGNEVLKRSVVRLRIFGVVMILFGLAAVLLWLNVA
jgi:hypothetical protein